MTSGSPGAEQASGSSRLWVFYKGLIVELLQASDKTKGEGAGGQPPFLTVEARKVRPSFKFPACCRPSIRPFAVYFTYDLVHDHIKVRGQLRGVESSLPPT